MDLQMPVMDGITAIKKIQEYKQNCQAKPDMKIIVLTAFQSTNDKMEVLQSGADDFLQKPVSVQSLINSIKNIQ